MVSRTEASRLLGKMFFQINKIVLLIVFNIFLMVTGDNYKDETMERTAKNGRARVVFTPIRGKRMFPDNRDILLRMLEAADALKYYYDQLPYYDQQADDQEANKVTKKVIFTPKLGRSSDDAFEKRGYENDFTPRLGRQADAVTASDEVYRQDASIDGRSKYFSPRLGRTMELTPRLGRSYNYELYPSKVRIARSTNGTKS